jgi:hypothetical protein
MRIPSRRFSIEPTTTTAGGDKEIELNADVVRAGPLFGASQKKYLEVGGRRQSRQSSFMLSNNYMREYDAIKEGGKEGDEDEDEESMEEEEEEEKCGDLWKYRDFSINVVDSSESVAVETKNGGKEQNNHFMLQMHIL